MIRIYSHTKMAKLWPLAVMTGSYVRSEVLSGTLNRVISMDSVARSAVVDTHNHWRSQTALGLVPDRGGQTVKAGKMLKIRYDLDLEKSSEDFAKFCHWGHSSPAGFEPLPYSIGENMWASSGKSQTRPQVDAIDAWSREHEDWSYEGKVIVFLCL